MCLEGTTEIVRVGVEEEGPRRITRRGLLAGMAAAGGSLALGLPAVAHASPSPRTHRLQDLTHVFRAGFPVYTFDSPSRRTLVTIPENGFYIQEWTFGEHSGTHMDAPGHFALGGRLSPEITPQELLVPIVVVDISARVASNPDAVVTVDDLVTFEHRFGRIPPRAIVCEYSGWESRVGDAAAYRNVGPDGLFHFPGFGIEAVEWLLEHRDFTGIGVDTLSLDNGPSQTFDVHHTLLGADHYGLENLANLKRIPPRGASAFVGLIPWEEGSGGPCRVVAQW
ncbi:MAG TPA: cyclase family protein [Actinomycetota bacterium]|jgi:kynurenine formamidase|nr:cyclase family protein [Actinomycetota bacterium]